MNTDDQRRNNWYYWTHNRYAHYIVWRNRDHNVATASVKPRPDGQCDWQVSGPCWSLFEASGVAADLPAAKAAADAKVMQIIKEEYAPEPLTH